jgi:hypothetical protein
MDQLSPFLYLISIDVLRLFHIVVDTGNGTLDALVAVVLVAMIFGGLFFYWRYGRAQRKSDRKTSKSK